MSDPSPAPAQENEDLESAWKRHARRALIAAGVVFIVVWFGILPRFRMPPDQDALRSFVTSQVNGGKLQVLGCTLEDLIVLDDLLTATAQVKATRLPEIGYLRLESGLTGHSPASFDLPKLKFIKDILATASGPRVLEIAGLDPEAEGLARLTVLKEMPLAGHPVTFPIMVRADRHGFKWNLSLIYTDNYRQAIKPGRFPPRSAFSGEVRIIGHPEDQERIAALVRRLPDIHREFERAVAAFIAERMPAVRKLIHPGALFAGTVIATGSPTDPVARVFLEITEVRDENGSPHFSALLRNDGGGDEKRAFAGRVVFAPATGELQLKLVSPISAEPGTGGPLLQNNYNGIFLTPDEIVNMQIRLAIDGTVLESRERSFSLRLEYVPAKDHAAVRAEMAGAAPALAAATAPGMLYTGTITDRVSGAKESVVLRFVTNPESTADIAAVLEHADRASWRCSFRGEYVANRYRRQTPAPIELYRAYSPAGAPPQEMLQRFGFTEPGVPLRLDLEGRRLVGEADRSAYRFEPAAPAAIARHEQWKADHDARLRAFIATGAIHEGVVEREGIAGAGRVRLHFVTALGSNRYDSSPPEVKARTVYAFLSAAGEPRFTAPLKGDTQYLAESRILFNTEESPHWPAGGLDDAPSLAAQLQHIGLHPEEFALSLEENGVVGIIESGKHVLRFRFTPSTPEQIAGFQREEAAAREMLRAFVQAGTKHAGSLAREGAPAEPAPVRLVITQYDERSRYVQAVLESTAPSGPRLILHGHCDPATGVLALRRGDGPLEPEMDLANDSRIKPHLVGDNYDEYGFFVRAGRVIGQSNSLPNEKLPLTFEPLASKVP